LTPRLSGARPKAVATALICLALIGSACGTRLSHGAIAQGGQQLVAGAASGGSQTSGQAGTKSTVVAGGAAGSGATGTAGSGSSGSSGSSGAAGGPSSGPAASGGPTAGKVGAASGSTINLGNVGTYSGLIGAIFSGAQQTLQAWAAYTNAHGGLNGHPVHLFIEDDGGDPSTNQTEVQQEVTQDHVIAFVGNLEPLTASASVSYLQQQNIPVIGGDSASAQWWQSPMLFPQASYIGGESNQSVRSDVAAGYTKMGVLYCIEDPTCTLGYSELIQHGDAKADGANPVYSASFSITQPDFTAQCLAAQQAGATVIYFAGDGDSLVRLARDCAAQGYKPLYDADSIGVTAAVQADSLLNGLFSTQSNFPWVDTSTPAQATYQTAMKTYAPSVAGSATTAAEWAAGMLAVAADQNLGATPTSAEFLQGLWSIKNNDLGGLAPPLTFNAHALPTPSQCYYQMILKNGQFSDPNHGTYKCM
jgi:branched-chain amino acid transport system substrate-binding protein